VARTAFLWQIIDDQLWTSIPSRLLLGFQSIRWTSSHDVHNSITSLTWRYSCNVSIKYFRLGINFELFPHISHLCHLYLRQMFFGHYEDWWPLERNQILIWKLRQLKSWKLLWSRDSRVRPHMTPELSRNVNNTLSVVWIVFVHVWFISLLWQWSIPGRYNI